MSQALLLSTCIVWVAAATAAPPLSLQLTEKSSSWTSITRHLDQLTAPLVLRFPQTTTSPNRTNNPDLLYILDTTKGLRLEPGNCQLTLKGLYPRRSPRRSTELREGLLAIWLRSEEYDKKRKHSGEWYLILVDFSKSAEAVANVESERNCPRIVAELRFRDSVDVVDVLPGRKGSGFDLVLGERGDGVATGVVHVLRYDEHARLRGQSRSDGARSSVSGRLQISGMDFHPFYTPKTLRIHPIEQSNPEFGYFLVQIIPQAHVSIVKRLNSNFEPIKSRTLKHSKHTEHKFDAYSADQGNFTICRFNGDSRLSFHCLMLDSMLNKRSKVNLKHVELASSPSTITHLQVKNTLTGGVLIAFAAKADGRDGSLIYTQLVDSDGRSSEAEILASVHCFIYEISIVHVKDLEFCINVVCDEIVHTKCFRTDELIF